MTRFCAAVRWAWTNKPADIIAAWVAIFWSYNLFFHNGLLSPLHSYLHDVMPLWCWASVCALLVALHGLSLHTLVIPRSVVMLLAGVWWIFVAVMFYFSGLSVTGFGTYLSIGAVCLYQSRVK